MKLNLSFFPSFLVSRVSPTMFVMVVVGGKDIKDDMDLGLERNENPDYGL